MALRSHGSVILIGSFIVCLCTSCAAPVDRWRNDAQAIRSSTGKVATRNADAKEPVEGVQKEAHQELESTFGVATQTDYAAKHFSVNVGAVILNQFQITKEPAENPTRFFLGDGSTEEQIFLEGAFRYRWAWLDRLPIQAKTSVQQDAANAAVIRRTNEYTTASRSGTPLEAGRARKNWVRALKDYDELAKVERAKATEGMSRTLKRTVPKRARGLTVSFPGSWIAAENPDGETAAAWLPPDDWTIRLGYAFSSQDSKSADEIVGASDLYGELTMGWNLLRWTMQQSDPSDTPIRGTASFETSMFFYTDKAIVDLHERVLVGLSLAVGVPIGSHQTDESGKQTPAPIAEVVTRFGPVYADLPKFDNPDERLLESRNRFPDYRGDVGFGFDLEMNVPVTKSLGYVTLRGSMNAGFDPNLWNLFIGYTVPIGNLAKQFDVK